MDKSAEWLKSLLKALVFPTLIGGMAYHNYRSDRLAKDPIYKLENDIEKMYQQDKKKRKKAPVSKPVYNISDFDEQMRRPLI